MSDDDATRDLDDSEAHPEVNFGVRKKTLRSGRRSQSPDEEPSLLWLVTFADTMALMLTFFVLLYAMSTPKEEAWTSMTGALNRQFSKFQSSKWQRGSQDTITIEKVDFEKAQDLDYLEFLIEEILERNSDLSGIFLTLQKDRLIISLPNDLMFESGSARVDASGKKALFTLGDFLSKLKNRIEVVGHSDPSPILQGAESFDSNWHLSLARALNVAGVLENAGYKKPVRVLGLSSSLFDELPKDIQGDERLRLARRVDVMVMKDTGARRGSLNVIQ